MSDPVAEKSSFLKMYMSNHPDTLVAYAKWYGHVQEPITSAEMSEISTKNMLLTCTFKDGSKREVRVELNPPLAGYEDVKPRLLEMKAIAQEGLGMIKSPVLSTFVFPRDALTTTFFPILALIGYTWAPKDSPSPVFAVARLLHEWGVRGLVLQGIWGFLCVAHSLEAMYIFNLARKHAGNFAVGAGYVFGTLVFGFPFMFAFRGRIQAARIDSVMKIQ